MSWRELSKEEREDIRKRFSMADYDALLAEIDRLLNEEVDDGQPVWDDEIGEGYEIQRGGD